MRLLEDRRLKVQVSTTGVTLLGSRYVGQAMCGDFLIDLHEKVPGATTALLGAASGSDLSRSRLARPITSDAVVQNVLIDCFLDEVFAYLSRHISRAYRSVGGEGATVRGRLDVAGTAAVWAKGLLHKAAYKQSELSSDVPINIVLYRCLGHLQRSQGIGKPTASQVLRIRQAAFLLSDVAAPSSRLTRATVARMADEIADTGSEVERVLAVLANAIISDAGLGAGPEFGGVVPQTWFINLESLFERAVRRALSRANSRTKVTKPRRGTRYLLPEDSLYSAEPDLLVEPPNGPALVGDVKYKDLGAEPDNADIYQLLAHAGAYEARKGFLVYPGESYSFRLLGTAVTGEALSVATLAFQDFAAGCSRLVHDLLS